MSEYQDWLLIDMHTHSEFSKYGKPSDSGRVKNMSAKEFVDTLYSYGVKIFSITDHNYFSEKYYNEIEHYINEEINFKGLVDYLLKKNLSSKVMLEDKVEEKTDSEENLIKLINSIINDYNDKVDELEKFKKENKD